MKILKEKDKPRKEQKKTDAQKKKILLTWFSLAIRLSSIPQGQVLGQCFTCGVLKEYKMLHAGHYIRASAGLSTYFDEKNVHAQCYACNIWRDGNSDEYALRLQKKYGTDILNELNIRKHVSLNSSSYPWAEKIEYYKNKVDILKKLYCIS